MRPYLFFKLLQIRARAREGCNFNFAGNEFLSALINSLTKPALPNAHRNGELTLKISQLAGMMLCAVPGETGMSLL
ncbi:hypothetical protein [Agrobacterium fabrum]|jgi:hypothetical protein|nr:hypothetical protein [Agrobacterium fabrum]MCR6723278.1 hypothetical protein [Agrobacterium fabrum]MCX2877310.1 hypothetical protein [Agrobacterium fabrum]NSZ10565.1 hypothetical protein [Agrobacterium fabrum]NTB06392.1 hypothetical protein [Agrobacterium fabrum]NTE59457.1 hypothetical protein [Agrobacterium fabrum]